jgi:hypothetical protein
MTRDSIIELADQWSERKGKQFNLQKLYELACQHICKQNRFWWAKKFITFNLAIGTPTYDLSTLAVTPALSETMVSEIISWKLVIPGAPATSFPKLTPIFDDEGIFSLLESTSTSQPGRYTMGVDGLQVLRIDPPDQAYKTRLTFWAVPNFNDDSVSIVVPLIPATFHNMIVENIAATVLENTYGLQDIKATTMRARYQASLLDAQMRPQFTTDYVQTFASQDSDAIQGT